MTKSTEEQPVAVPERTIRTGKAWDPRFWVEPTVWTERMLAALEQGVKGGNAFFAEQGLYSLKAAHALACQSSSR
jgi:hypothetical protein